MQTPEITPYSKTHTAIVNTGSMTNMSYSDSAEISSLACIENGRSVDEHGEIVVYDVVIPTSELVNGSKEILCALGYAPDYDEETFLPGFYRIRAKVWFSF